MKRRKRLKDKQSRNSGYLETRPAEARKVSDKQTQALDRDDSLLEDIKSPPQGAVGSQSRRTTALGALQQQYGNQRVGRAVEASGSPQSRTEVLTDKEKKSSGEPLSTGIRREMENLLEEDLSEVRVHHDDHAGEGAGLLRAKAYTRGKDIYFGKGRYAPESRRGFEILAHELTHVVQTGGKRRSGQDAFAKPHSGIEREARDSAKSISRGKKAVVDAEHFVPSVLRLEEEAEAVPMVTRYGHEITPAHKRGTINAGPFSVSFYYDITETAAMLVLHLPEGAEASFSALGGIPEADFKVNDPGGAKARRVTITMSLGSEEIPRLRAMFSQESVTCVVIFQFPV